MRYIIQVQLKRKCCYDFQIPGGPEANSPDLFFLADKVQRVVDKVKHSGHAISDDQCDDDDVQCCKVYTRATVLTHKKVPYVYN